MAVSFLRWRFEDPADPTLASTYTFALNPNQMSSPFPRRNITAKATTAINGRTVLIEGQRQPAEWTFSGDFLEPNHYEALRAWVLDRTGRRVFLWDHFGRKMTVVPIQFNPTPKRVIARYWRHTYEITCLVLDIEGPTFRVDPPYAPRQVAATAKYERSVVTWQPPLSARGSAILYYTIYDDTQGDSHRVEATGELSCSWSNRTVGNHTYRVTATSTAGESEGTSTTVYVSPIIGPFGIAITSAVATYGEAVIKWNPPTDNGGAELLNYNVWITDPATGQIPTSNTTPNKFGPFSVGPTVRKFTFQKLGYIREKTYNFNVSGENEREEGPTVTRQLVMPKATGPSKCVILEFRTSLTSAYMRWAPPVRNGGFALRDYQVYVDSKSSPTSSDDFYPSILPLSQTEYLFTGLTPGAKYRFFIQANNVASLGGETNYKDGRAVLERGTRQIGG